MTDSGGTDDVCGWHRDGDDDGCRSCRSASDDDQLALDPDRLPRWADRRSVTIAPGDSIEYRAEEWHDSMLIVTKGSIELESPLGSVHGFDSGSILWCQGLPIRFIRATGPAPAVLLSISRRPRPP